MCIDDMGCISYFVNTYITYHSSIINGTSGYISIYNCLCRTISTIGQKYIVTMVYNRGIKFGIHV